MASKRSVTDDWLLSNEEMRATINIAQAVNAARRRDGGSRLRIAKTLTLLAAGLVDNDPLLARELIKAMREFCDQLSEPVCDDSHS